VHKPYLLLGEGKRDRLFFEFLCRNRGITDIQFDEGQGFQSYERLLKSAWSARTGFDALKGLIIVGDNDPNENKTFLSIRDQLKAAKLASPTEPLQIAHKKESPPVVIVMMPFFGAEDRVEGALESMLIPVIENTYPRATACFNSMFECVGAGNWKSASSKDKLKVRCILSCSCEENPMAGVEKWFESSSNLIPFSDPNFKPIIDLLDSIPVWFESGVERWADWKAANTK
jgi:hypothetical protein